MRTTVLIADDNAFVRTALYEFFDREPDFHVCAIAENGQQAIEAASRLHPDLIVLDRTDLPPAFVHVRIRQVPVAPSWG